MDIKVYETLPQEAMEIRQAVFVTEQGFFDEFDKMDGNAKHIVVFDEKTPIAPIFGCIKRLGMDNKAPFPF